MFSKNFFKCIKQIELADYFIKATVRNFSRTRTLESEIHVSKTIVNTLKTIVGETNVSTANAVREQHGHDESHHEISKPDVVVFAESVEHVSQVAKLCNDNKIPLIPFGSGTGLEGGVNALFGGVTLDLTKMNKVMEVNAEDFDCTVQPGVMRIALNAYLRDTGLWFPIDPGADASICGMCATSASGTNAVRYGTMRENVLNLQVVLPDGRIIHTAGKGTRSRKTSAGYNLTNLFVGSEGTLGIITQATIKLYGIPEKTIAAVCHFNTVQQAVDTVVQIMQSGISMAKLEFLDDKAIEAFNKFSKFNMPVSHSLFLEFHGPALGLDDQFNTVRDIIELNNGQDLQTATDENERKRLWKARHEMLWACTALVPGSKPYSTDVCVPISNLPEMILKTKQWIIDANVVGPMVGHVGDGNFHVFFPVNKTDKDTYETVKNISHKMGLLAMELSGTCTGEHGIGMGKRELLEKEIGPVGIQVTKELKKCFDPNGIMNPGKVIF